MRPLRWEEPEAVYHVLDRGNCRARVLGDDDAKAAFLRYREQACAKPGWVIHAGA